MSRFAIAFVVACLVGSPAFADSPPRLILDAAGGLFLPGINNFGENHGIGPAFVGEVGYFFNVNEEHRLGAMIGAGYTFHALDDRFVAENTTMLNVYAGIRYVPMFMSTASGAPFFNLALGVLTESAEAEAGHSPPKGELTALVTAGYFLALGRNLRVGARIDFIYFEGDTSRTLAWLSPMVFAGLRL